MWKRCGGGGKRQELPSVHALAPGAGIRHRDLPARYKASGGNAFREYQLPEAALALKQGVGRLIRSETDRGVVVICDPRLIDKPYGRVFRARLPPMPVTREPEDASRFLRRIAGVAPPAVGALA